MDFKKTYLSCLLALLTAGIIFYGIYILSATKERLVGPPEKVHTSQNPDSTQNSAFKETRKAKPGIDTNLTLFSIDSLHVKFYYKSSAEVWLEIGSGQEFYANAVDPSQLPGILAMVGTGKARFNIKTKEILLDTHY